MFDGKMTKGQLLHMLKKLCELAGRREEGIGENGKVLFRLVAYFAKEGNGRDERRRE